MPTRRRLIVVTGGAFVTSLAGCVTNSNSPAGGSDDDNSGNSTDNDNGGESTGASDEHDHESGHELGYPETQIDVRMESDGDSNHFVPHVVHIEEGGTVRWVLESGAHDTVSYHQDNAGLLPSATERRMPEEARPWRSELYRTRGKTFERTFEEAGIYDYTCTVVEHGHGPDRGHGPPGHHQTHEATGMVGRVIVGWPELDPNVQPALQPPADGLPNVARREIEGFNERTRAALEHPDEH